MAGVAGYRGVSPGGAGGGRRRGMGLGDAGGPVGPEGIDKRGGGGVACRREDDSVRAGGPGGPPGLAAADRGLPPEASR